MTVDPERRRYEFRHALLHEAVYRDVLPGERRRYHTSYAEQLTAERAGARGPAGIEDLAELAHHWRGAGRRGRGARRHPGGRGRGRGRATPRRRPTATTSWRCSCGIRRRAPLAGGRPDARTRRSDRAPTGHCAATSSCAPRTPPAAPVPSHAPWSS